MATKIVHNKCDLLLYYHIIISVVIKIEVNLSQLNRHIIQE